MLGVISNLEDWIRAGRGKSFQFFATDQEVAHLLQISLPSEYRPYSIVSYEIVREGNNYMQIPIFCEMHDFLKIRKTGLWQFFIRSHLLTPTLPVNRGESVLGVCATNGLVNLQQGCVLKKKFCESSIGVVDKISNKHTGEVIHHTEYANAFNTLKKAIRSILRYTSTHTWKNGQVEESKDVLMSEEIVQQYWSGNVVLSAVPGSPHPNPH